MRLPILIALCLVGCGVEPELTEPDPESPPPDGGPADASTLPVEPKPWAVYRGTEQLHPGFTDGNAGTELLLALSLDDLADGADAPAPLPNSEQISRQRWSHDGAWLVEMSSYAKLTIWDMSGATLSTPKTVSTDLDFSIDDLVPSPVDARFLVVAFDRDDVVGEKAFYMLDAERATAERLALEAVTGALKLPSWSPAGDALLVESEVGEDGFRELSVIDASEPERAPLPLVPPSGYWDTTSWSPDGRWVTAETSSFAAGHTLFLINVAEARPDARATPWRARHDEGLRNEADNVLAWSPNGAWLLLRSSIEGEDFATELQLLDMRGDQPSEPFIPAHQRADDGLDPIALWSPDSRYVVVVRLVTGELTTELVVLDTAHPNAESIFEHRLPASITEPFVAWTARGALVFQEGSALFSHALDGDSEPELLTDDLRIDDPSSALQTHVQLAPDRSKLLYASGSRDDVLGLITFGDASELRTVELDGELADSPAQWRADSAGFIAFVDPNGNGCTYGCVLDYVALDANAEPRPPVRAAGQITAPFDSVLQP